MLIIGGLSERCRFRAMVLYIFIEFVGKFLIIMQQNLYWNVILEIFVHPNGRNKARAPAR